MNINYPFFKKVQKISRTFNAKPMFLDYNDKLDKPFLRPYKKYKDDCPELIFVKGIPLYCVYSLWSYDKSNMSTKLDNLFYNKNYHMYNLINTDGYLSFVIAQRNDTIFAKKVLADGSIQNYKEYKNKSIYEVTEQIKEENKEMFYF